MPEAFDLQHLDRDEAHRPPISRRRFLERSAMAVAGGLLFSCTGGKVIPKVSRDPSPSPTMDTQWPIKRVVYLMLENRSFDNLFGTFPGADGTTTGVAYGKEIPLLPCPDWLPGDLPHDRAAALACLNNGKLDGFGGGIYGMPFSYTQFKPNQIPHSIPNYWGWAKDNVLSDRFFASALGPSYPNHFYFVAGTDGGVIDNPENIGAKVLSKQKPDNSPRLFKSWGCDALAQDGKGVFVFTKDDRGSLTKHSSCFEMPTVGEQLTDSGIDWAFYSAPPDELGYFWNSYNAIGNVFHTDLWHQHTRSTDHLIQDIQANKLPPVTWVTPRFQLSDHPPSSSAFTHNWVSDVVNAIMRSPMWEHTAVFITWDEWGGFYDHVEPPKIDQTGLGFRVPLLTISPYAKKGLIDHEVSDFASPLKFISDNWGLHHLTGRIKKTSNLESHFDFHQKPRKPNPSGKKAKTYGSPWVFPRNYPGWPEGTIPPEKDANPFG